MIRRLFRYGWSVRREFGKYFIVGASGFVLDFASLILIRTLFGVSPTVAVIFNQPLLLAFNFTLNKYWTFRNREIPHTQLVRYLTLAAGNYIFSVLLMYIFNHQLGFEYKLVRLGTILLAVSWNFFLYKYWVYKISQRSEVKSLKSVE